MKTKTYTINLNPPTKTEIHKNSPYYVHYQEMVTPSSWTSKITPFKKKKDATQFVRHLKKRKDIRMCVISREDGQSTDLFGGFGTSFMGYTSLQAPTTMNISMTYIHQP